MPWLGVFKYLIQSHWSDRTHRQTDRRTQPFIVKDWDVSSSNKNVIFSNLPFFQVRWSSMWGARGTRWDGTLWTSSPPPDWADSGTASLTGVRVTLLNLSESASLRWTFSGLIQICDSYSLEDREYFFDRSPRNFDAILGLYRNGKLHLAAGVSEWADKIS